MLTWSPPPWLAATASTTPMRSRRWDGQLGCMVKAPSTLVPAQLSLGACPSTRPREPPVAGPGMGRAGPGDSPLTIGTRPSARPMDRRERATTATPRARVSPAAGHCRRHRRGADVPSARGPPPAAPPTSSVRRWGGCATAGLQHSSRCGPTAASMATLSFPPAGKSAPHRRQHASLRDLIEAIPEEDWTPIP